MVARRRVVLTKQAQKDAKKLSSANLRSKTEELLEVLREDPFRTPLRYEKLIGDLAGAYSRRINIQHRLVYDDPRRGEGRQGSPDVVGRVRGCFIPSIELAKTRGTS